jgi:hypothetical protein
MFSCSRRAGPSFCLPRHAEGWKVEVELELESSHLRQYLAGQKSVFEIFQPSAINKPTNTEIEGCRLVSSTPHSEGPGYVSRGFPRSRQANLGLYLKLGHDHFFHVPSNSLITIPCHSVKYELM